MKRRNQDATEKIAGANPRPPRPTAAPCRTLHRGPARDAVYAHRNVLVVQRSVSAKHTACVATTAPVDRGGPHEHRKPRARSTLRSTDGRSVGVARLRQRLFGSAHSS